MEQNPQNQLEQESTARVMPDIPPPNLTPPPPPPPPPSPLSNLPPPSSTPAAGNSVDFGGKVNLRPEDADLPSTGKGIAPFGTRLAAGVLDFLVCMGIMIGLTFLLPAFAHRLAWLTGIAYLVTRDSLPFLGGQSVGKKAMGLRAVTLEGKSLVGDWQTAFIRNAVLMIPLFPLVELIVLLTREDKPEHGRRLGDEWAKTKVITAEKPGIAEVP